MFAASGTGAMDASVSNLFSTGDKVIVCVAGKFGERWVEIAKAYGLDANVLTVPYGEAVSPEQVEAALKAEPPPRVFSCRHRRLRPARRTMWKRWARGREDRRHLRRRRHHRPRHHAARYRRLGPGRGDRRLAEGLHDSAGPGVPVGQPQSLEARRDLHAAALLLQSEEGEEERRRGRIQLDAGHVADSGAGRSAEIRQADRHGQPDRERASAGRGDARGRAEARAGTVRRRLPRLLGHRRQGARRAWIPA